MHIYWLVFIVNIEDCTWSVVFMTKEKRKCIVSINCIVSVWQKTVFLDSPPPEPQSILIGWSVCFCIAYPSFINPPIVEDFGQFVHLAGWSTSQSNVKCMYFRLLMLRRVQWIWANVLYTNLLLKTSCKSQRVMYYFSGIYWHNVSPCYLWRFYSTSYRLCPVQDVMMLSFDIKIIIVLHVAFLLCFMLSVWLNDLWKLAAETNDLIQSRVRLMQSVLFRFQRYKR